MPGLNIVRVVIGSKKMVMLANKQEDTIYVLGFQG
jgi:hypothetical protein